MKRGTEGQEVTCWNCAQSGTRGPVGTLPAGWVFDFGHTQSVEWRGQTRIAILCPKCAHLKTAFPWQKPAIVAVAKVNPGSEER